MGKHTFDIPGISAVPALSTHVFLLRGGEVLLTRRAPGAAYAPGLWHAGMAGKVDPGEDVAAATVRECAEELGVRVRPGDLEFAHVMHSQEGAGWVHFFFTCTRWDGTPANLEPRKHTEIAWFPTGRLPEDMVAYCRQALVHTLAGEPFSQHRTRTPFPAR
ncbi:NUDIX hydrolase [Nocardiopsis algeriensis]|uniref:8-oxo-dGTP pyrophosphatase MutT (NUDIX family) n=1 Tax=Nocardiopsis algeriensis TaxID=1478215 RepID=A0A841IQH7_9ACTN|nr:NUDIX domain-containing protein [Nocardiopsis algeriensis]MBB6119516.1 8-oxo-dGTP pyrophosphatase MutT (NUDIX family) [Nocardiopsis algeriensis]